MNATRKQEIWREIVADLVDMNVGPNQNVPVKTIWLRAVKRGVSNASELEEALAWAVEQGWLTTTPGGPGGLGGIALTDAGYEQSRAEDE